MGKSWVWILGGATLVLGCGARHVTRVPGSGPVDLVLIHTADLHSHLFPEPLLISQTDAARGLGSADVVAEVGGYARVATIVGKIRAGAEHSLYLDSGDLIEGTDAFTAFGGEPEMRALSALGVGAVALGNHDLDPGSADFVEKHRKFATFPVLAANYGAPDTDFGRALSPSVVLDAAGVRVGVIGVANPSSPGDVADANNPYGIVLEPVATAVQRTIDALRPSVDLIVAVTHLGLDADEALIRATSGLDVVLGGHQHLAIDEALERLDCGSDIKGARGCQQRRVILVHSGAFGRYVGRVGLSLAPAAEPESADGLEVVSAQHSLLPVSAEIAADPTLSALLDPYRVRLAAAGFDAPVAFAEGPVERYGATGGDSALGDLVADAIRERTGADFAVLNTTGIRADLPPGVLTKSAFVAALPFADTLTVLSLTGSQMISLMTKQARLASSRDCQSPLQIAGFTLKIACHGSASSAEVKIAGAALVPAAPYTLVTTAYLAGAGSGFDSLSPAASAGVSEGDPLDILLAAVAALPACTQSALPCIAPDALRDGRIVASRN